MSKNDSLLLGKTLFVDIGNTSVKVGQKDEGKWKYHIHNEVSEAAKSINRLSDNESQVVIGSVRKTSREKLIEHLETQRVRVLSIADLDTDKLDYDSPETLGMDRYLACLGARCQSGRGVVVIDAGTACTIDYMDTEDVFRGGVIMPGLKTIAQSLRDSAPELPEVELSLPERFPGRSTTESLQWGQVGFFIDGILTMLEAYEQKYPGFELYLTGGDAETLFGLLETEGNVDPHLVMKGMESLVSD